MGFDLDSLFSFCEWAGLTFAWLTINAVFCESIKQAIRRHNDSIRGEERRCQKALREKAYDEGFVSGRNIHMMLDSEEEEEEEEET